MGNKKYLSKGQFPFKYLTDARQLRSRPIGKCVHASKSEASLPQNATETEKFLKLLEIWVFFDEIYGFLEKKT